MSEFSDCYFLHDRTPKDVEALLKSGRRYGMVLQPTGRFVPFVVDGLLDAGNVALSVVEHNPGVLLHYAYAEDQGLRLTAFDGVVEAFVVYLQRRGPSEIERETVLGEVDRLRLTERDAVEELEGILSACERDVGLDLENVRAQLADVFKIEFPVWLGCADLSLKSERQLRERFPSARFILKSLRGKADKEARPEPNEWCPKADLPPFMYIPIPRGDVDGATLERHVHHWLTTRDWDEDRQVGFWMHTAYSRALPSRFAFLPDRIMNLELAFPGQYEAKLRDTIRAILTVSARDFDWEPYLACSAGEQRL